MRNLSMPGLYRSVTSQSIPAGHLLNGKYGAKCATMRPKKEVRRIRIQQLIDWKCDGTQADFANRVGVPANLVSRYLSGAKGIGEDMKDKIEAAFDLPPHWLDQEPELGQQNFDAPQRPPGKVPLISWVQAGDYKQVIDNLTPGDAEEWVDATVPVRKHTFALRVSGDSMEPDFPEGSIIIVEPTLLADPGDYVIVRNGEHEATFKQLIRDGGDWMLRPINPRYPIKPMPRDAVVCGVVRQVLRTIR